MSATTRGVGRPRTYDRPTVLRRAMQLFWQRGFEGAHLQDLVEATGLNRFSLYKEFGGKEHLFREALDLYLDEQRAANDQTLGREPLGLANVHAYFETLSFPRGYHGCMMINTLTEKHVVSAATFRAAKRYAEDAQSLFLANLEAARAAGELAPSQDPVHLAALLATYDQGLAVHGIITPEDGSRQAIVAFLDSIRAPPGTPAALTTQR